MLAEIKAGFDSLKMAKDIVQGLNALKTEAAVNEVKVQLQGLILAAQQSLFAAQQTEAETSQRVSALEEEIMRLKDWSGERKRYELRKFTPGSLAYVLKPTMAGGEPLHMLCKHCYDRTEKGTLQPTGRLDQRFRIFACSTCRSELPMGEQMSDEADKRLNPRTD